jgi:tryptophan-rich sensory protein
LVWTVLYVFLGIALAQTLMLPESSGKYWLLGFYAYNLVQNVSWSYVFFGEHEVKLALFILGEMLLSTGLILWQTYRLLPLWVGNLLVPYMAWLMFATVLNIDMLFKSC